MTAAAAAPTSHSALPQFPFKKRSGELFMALVTKSPLYEDGQLIGVVTVSSDAVVFNNLTSEQPRKLGFDRRRIQWPHRPQIASVPQMASSFSDLSVSVFHQASRVLLGKGGDNIPDDREGFDFDLRDSNLHHHEDITRGASGGRVFQEEESLISVFMLLAAVPCDKFDDYVAVSWNMWIGSAAFSAFPSSILSTAGLKLWLSPSNVTLNHDQISTAVYHLLTER